jgi:hypothetical protein
MQVDRSGLKPGEAEELAEFVAMGIELNKDAFQFTSYAHEEVSSKLDFTVFDALNNQIDLKEFGEGMNIIGFAFIVLPPTTFPQEQHIQYYPNHKEVSISLPLNYEQFVNATPEEAIMMMKQVYLNGLRVLPLFAIPDFDVAGLIGAAEKALEM